MSRIPLHFAMLSDPGRVRRQNEDACAADLQSGVFVVCDGVGGAAAGEIASRLASETFVSEVVSRHSDGISSEAVLREAIDLVNRAVYRQARQTLSLRGMATTMVALFFDAAPTKPETSGSVGTVWLANIGDSRCYRLRQGQFELLTQDHSVVEEQVRAGEMTREQADRSPIRNVITRAIGSEAAVQPDLQCLQVEPGDVYLLASDGLTRELGDDQIATVLLKSVSSSGDAALASACHELVRAANQSGGGDNITCLLVEVEK